MDLTIILLIVAIILILILLMVTLSSRKNNNSKEFIHEFNQVRQELSTMFMQTRE